MKRLALAAISIALLIISACTQKTPDLPKEMVMETTEFSLSADGGKIDLKFIPLSSWTALCEEDWVNCSQQSGEASVEETVLTVDVSENKGAERTAELVLSFETNDITITIKQAGAEAPVIEETEYTVSADGEEIEIKFAAPTAWEASCDKDWISIDPESGRASTRKKTMYITVDRNETLEKRSAVVVVAFEDTDVEITITQEAAEDEDPDPDPEPGPTPGPEDEVRWILEFSEDGGDSWTSVDMQLVNGAYVVADQLFITGAYLRFLEVATGTYYGCPNSFKGSGKTNTKVSLASGESWWWFYMYCEGYYDIYLNPEEMSVYIMSDGCHPDELPTDYTIYEKYSDMFSVSDNSSIKVFGVVQAKCGNGFIIALEALYYNNIFVYDPNDLCSAELGNWIDLYATKTTNNNLPEIIIYEGAYWCHKLDDQVYDYAAELPVVIENLSAYDSDCYDYIRFVGTLELSTNSNGKTYYNLTDGIQTACKGSISTPLADIKEYEGQKVMVEGYYTGSTVSGSTTYVNLVMKKIIPVNDDTMTDGSTEDITPGTGIPLARPYLSRSGSPSPYVKRFSIN